jgi:hypothetical protein
VKNYVILITIIVTGLLFFLIYRYTNNQNLSNNPITNNKVSIIPSSVSLSLSPTPASILGMRTKKIECKINNSLPDQDCTPGAVFDSITKESICMPGYSKNVRNVPQKIKDEVYSEYGIITHNENEYEVDHLISLELGGSNDISNLWPEPAVPKPGYHEKDKVENYLHSQVCKGLIDLKQAQTEISSNWMTIYESIR